MRSRQAVFTSQHFANKSSELKGIPYGRHSVEEADCRAVLEVLQSDWLTTGPRVAEFETKFAEYVEAGQAVAVNSGTAALHSAMYALGIGSGDEVILPPITFVATANAVVYQGATPVFVDVDPDTLLIDPLQVEANITAQTKAIVAVDYAGNPCDYDALESLARKYKLSIIDDACHALGAEYHAERVGSLADITVFSFHPVKHITTGEGGMITTDRIDLAERMRRFRNHGIDVDHHHRTKLNTWYYEMADLGFNYRLSDIQCALGINQMTKLPSFLNNRRAIAARYNRAFEKIPGINPLNPNPDGVHAYHLYVIRVESQNAENDRQRIFEYLRSRGIGVNVHYYPVHLQPYYRKNFQTGRGLCPVAEKVSQQILSLPIYPDLTTAETDHIINEVKSALGRQPIWSVPKTITHSDSVHSTAQPQFVLGTAQLGMPYGIANQSGQPDLNMAADMIAVALDNGIIEFDTAQAYGSSEAVLGQVFKQLGVGRHVKVISKLHPNLAYDDRSSLETAVRESISRLGVPKLAALMLHREGLLDNWDRGIGRTLLNLKDRLGLVTRLGVSVHSPQKAIQALKHRDISIIQIPSNVLDRRFEAAGVFELAATVHKTIYVRSIFLQGLILMSAQDLPRPLQKASEPIQQLDRLTAKYDLTRSQLALAYAKQAYAGAKLVIGVETSAQLKQNIADWNLDAENYLADEIRGTFGQVEPEILNPALWEVNGKS